MADDIDVRLSELELKREQERTIQGKNETQAKKTVGFFNFVVGGVIGALAAYGTAYLNYSGKIEEVRLQHVNKGREIDLELAKLSLTILSGEYKDDIDETLPARMFALNALEKGTGVPISDSDKRVWARTGITPAGDAETWNMFGHEAGPLGAAKIEDILGISARRMTAGKRTRLSDWLLDRAFEHHLRGEDVGRDNPFCLDGRVEGDSCAFAEPTEDPAGEGRTCAYVGTLAENASTVATLFCGDPGAE